MIKRFYGKKKVEVIRQYRVGGESFVELRELGTGKKIKNVKSGSELLSEKPVKTQTLQPKKKAVSDKKQSAKVTKPVQKVVISNDKEVATFVYPSKELDSFINAKKLNKTMVNNCIVGQQKTHKGYTFDLVTE